MTATADRYTGVYVSEILKESGSYSDCGASVAIMLAADWTLGEWITRPDGRQRDVLELREVVRKRIGDTTGGLTLHDMNDIIHELDPEIAPLPRYDGQAAKPGQSTQGANLHLTWEEFRALVSTGSAAALCGNPSGVKDEGSPLRTKQGSDDYPHVIHVAGGNANGARVKDPLTRRLPTWLGEMVRWDDLRQFTEARHAGVRQFGSPSAIACAVIRIGSETEAARTGRLGARSLAKCRDNLDAARAQTALALDERDQARRELAACMKGKGKP